MYDRQPSLIFDTSAPLSTPPATILIVDDDAIGREMLAALLRPQGYRLFFANDGIEALDQAAKLLPDLILLDAMMPHIDGFEVCERLRIDPMLREMPVIMLTALDNRESRLQAIEAGADDFISKPFDRIELQARVCTITRLNRYRRLIAERTKFARVIEFSPDGLLIVNKTGEIQLANSAMGQLLRITEQDNLINQIIDSFVVVEQRNHCHTELQRIFNDPSEIARFETMLLCQDGTRIPVEMHVGWLEWDGYPAAQIVARDITKRKEAELLEEERRHIAYELHDGLAQIVTSTHQHLQAFASRFRPRSPQAQSDLSLAMTLAQRAVREVRRVIGGLRPTALDDFGITAALQMHVAALRAENWDITFEQTLGNERLSPTIETVVYRVTQEALTNIRKHAYPCRVHISLQRLPSELRLEIQDWGKGFDPNAVSESMALGEHIGLRGMRERVSLLGGQWCISSAINQGTHIIAQIPLSNTNKGECHDEG